MIGAVPQAFAQSSAVLKVTGTIVPPACTPTFEGGSTIDFGQVSARAEFSKVGEKKTSLRIACTAPSFIAFKVTDNRNGHGSMSFRVESNTVTGASPARTDWPAGA
nr:DUF1120 domain-containing protein [Burkholderia multivorans]